MSRIDFIYRKLVPANFYSRGWGTYEHLSKIVYYRRNWVGKRDKCLSLVYNDYPVTIDKEYNFKDHTLIEGSFITPFFHLIPDLLPPEVQKAKFQFLIPKNFSGSHKPVVLHFAGTGDHGFWRRRAFLAKPLLFKNSVASILIENPYYGVRRPKEQQKSNLLYVKDLFTMGGCLVSEGIVLMKWCEKLGLGPFALTGLSMGGHMASLTSTVWPKPIALIPCLSWTTAATVFTRGVLSKAVAWKELQKDFYSNSKYKELKEELKDLHNKENAKRDRKKICSFVPESNIRFDELTNYNDSKKQVNMEIVEFMHLLMDECTHMLNFDHPIDTNLIHVVAAKDDAYVLRDGVNDFYSIWPGCTIEYIDQGHVSAFVLALPKFRERIIETINKMIQKHYSKNQQGLLNELK